MDFDLVFYALWFRLQNAIQLAQEIEQEEEAIRGDFAEERDQEVYEDSHPNTRTKQMEKLV